MENKGSATEVAATVIVPPGCQSDGLWLLFRPLGGFAYHCSTSDGKTLPPLRTDRVRHKMSGLSLTVEEALVYLCTGSNGQPLIYSVRGERLFNGLFTLGTVTPLHNDLMPLVESNVENVAQRVNEPCEHRSTSIRGPKPTEGEEEPTSTTATPAMEDILTKVPLQDAPKQRPPGTISSGSWYKISDNGMFIYGEVHGGHTRYFTSEGTQIDPFMNASEECSKAVEYHYPADEAAHPGYSSSQRLLVKGPAGTQPGGRWYKQRYRGPTTNQATNVACCLDGCCAAAVVSQMNLDERWLYKDPAGTVSRDGSRIPRFVDIQGRFVFVQHGNPPIPMPDDFSPLGTSDHSRIIQR